MPLSFIGGLLIIILAFVLFSVRREESRIRAEKMPRGKVEKYWGGAERRRHVRFDALLDVRYTMKKGSSANNAKSKDISKSGVRLLVDKKLEQGAILYIDVLQGGQAAPISLEGIVVWCNEAKDKPPDTDKRLFHAGIELTMIADGSRQVFTDLISSLGEGQKANRVPDGRPLST